MLVLEALRAKFGDSLLLHFGTAEEPRLVLIDGGPPGVYNDALKPRLQQLREERGLDAATPLAIDLAMVSHVDADHIAGLLDLVRKLKDLHDSHQPVPWKIDEFWHNSFDDILGNQEVTVASTGSAMSPASIGDLLRPAGSLLLASVGQGRELRNLLAALNLAGNPSFRKAPSNGMVLSGHAPITFGDLKLTVVAPSQKNLLALQKDWDQKIKPILKKEQDQAARAQIASYVDTSVYNLSSIVVLVESAGKRILLTGDGRGDHTLEGLAAAGLLDAQGKIEIDVLKMPHHGSDRDVDLDYFQKIRAKHYVISADGKFNNPDIPTLQLISKARPDDDFTIHLTYPTDAFELPAVGKAVADFFAAERAAGRKYRVETRKPEDLSLRIELA
jgi:ribonuclease BN (tRNA processing enzyme)